MVGLIVGLSVFGLACFLLWLKTDHNRIKHMSRRLLTGLVILVMVSLSILLTFGSPWTKNYGERLFQPQVAVTGQKQLDTTAGGTDSAEIRWIVWQGAVKVWQRYPLFGSGVETFAYSYYQDRPLEHNLVSEWDFLYNKAHNEWLNFLATTGVVGCISYSFLVGSIVLWPLWHSIRSPKQAGWSAVSAAVAAGVLGLSISNFFGFSTVMVNVLLLLLPAMVVVLQPRSHQSTSLTTNTTNTKNQEFDTPTGIGLALIWIFVLMVLITLISWWRADAAYARGKQYLQVGATQEGVSDLERAVRLSPNEALFYEELGSTYAKVAVALAEKQDLTNAATYAQKAIDATEKMISLNPAHLNFRKTEARVYMTLSELNPIFLTNARAAIQTAIHLAPTDPKLGYFFGLVLIAQDHQAEGLSQLEAVLGMKPNYHEVRLALAQEYARAGQKKQALAHYQTLLNTGISSPEILTAVASLSANKSVR